MTRFKQMGGFDSYLFYTFLISDSTQKLIFTITTGKAILDIEEGKECLRAYTAIMASLQAYEDQHREEWALEIENTSAEKLKQPLLGRNSETSMIFVNFE